MANKFIENIENMIKCNLNLSELNKNRPGIYIGFVGINKNKILIKVGESTDPFNRNLDGEFYIFIYLYIFPCIYHKQFESLILDNFARYKYTDKFKKDGKSSR